MSQSRRRFFRRLSASIPVLMSWPVPTFAELASGKLDTGKDIIPAPDEPSFWPSYREALNRWRTQTLATLQYDDTLYRRPDLRWSAANYCCGFIMVWDRDFYDPDSGSYTIDSLLDKAESELGGYDSIVLWHAYPRIGVDERNQFDFYRDLPGGLGGLRRVVRRCHRRGVRVYIDYNPWDSGTRREGRSDTEALVALVSALEADGIFLDTLKEGRRELRSKLDASRRGVVLEGELSLPLECLATHQASWAQWFADSKAPGVLRAKWVERRHMQHQIRRWDRDHTAELHTAWMNGSGMLVWENVFGCRVPWSSRDRSLLRAMLPIQRRFTALFSGEQWTPLVKTEMDGVFASLWEGCGLRLWTLINRTAKQIDGTLLKALSTAHHRYFDLIAGKETYLRVEGQMVSLPGQLVPRGVGCFLSGPTSALGKDFGQFLAAQAGLNQRRNLDASTPEVANRLVVKTTALSHPRVPSGMVQIPAATLDFKIEMRVRECGFYDSSPPSGDVYNFQTRQFDRRVSLPRFAIDETPITNQEFAEFLKLTKYRPAHAANFLKHWRHGAPPQGTEEHPVVYVGLQDARAFALWAGKRLPSEEEWQYAAQGADGQKFPWGRAWESGRCNEGQTGTTTPVRAFPSGCSPFGCYDMCGNVWQWTESERTDGHTRFCIIRGGSFYQAKGSNWYLDGGPRPANFATKFLLLWPGLDRCSTIGFRCVADL